MKKKRELSPMSRKCLESLLPSWNFSASAGGSVRWMTIRYLIRAGLIETKVRKSKREWGIGQEMYRLSETGKEALRDGFFMGWK